MAFYEDDDDENQNPEAQGSAVQTGAESAVISGDGGGSSNAPQANAAGTPDKGANFTGIKTYLDANKPQAAKLGDQTAGVINQSADAARQGVASLNQEAQEKVKGVNALDEGVSNKLSTAAETLSDDERNNVKKTAAAQYKGPQTAMDLAGYQNAATAQAKAQTNIDNSGTEEGRMGLVSQINSKPRTQGMNVFDNALLSAGGGREKLAQSAAANADVKTGLTNAVSGIGQQIGAIDDPSTPDVDESAGAMGQTAKAQADAYKKIQDAMNGWKSGFTPKVDAAREQVVGQQNRITQDIGDNAFNLTPETMAALGLADNESTWGLDLNKYLNLASPGDVNAGNVADATDYARYSALADLSGDTSGLLNPADAAKAGTAPKFSVDDKKLRTDLMGAQQKYENDYQNTRGGFLDMSNILGQNTASKDPNGRVMAEATPKEIEDYWIPLMQSRVGSAGDDHNSWGQMVDYLKQNLKNWKTNQHAFNYVNPSTSGGGKGDVIGGNAQPTGSAGKY